jgi:hypothetical protein
MIIEPKYSGTTPFYWDCNCDHDYIHPKTEVVCKVCGANYLDTPHDYPDSMVDEVIKMMTGEDN